MGPKAGQPGQNQVAPKCAKTCRQLQGASLGLWHSSTCPFLPFPAHPDAAGGVAAAARDGAGGGAGGGHSQPAAAAGSGGGVGELDAAANQLRRGFEGLGKTMRPGEGPKEGVERGRRVVWPKVSCSKQHGNLQSAAECLGWPLALNLRPSSSLPCPPCCCRCCSWWCRHRGRWRSTVAGAAAAPAGDQHPAAAAAAGAAAAAAATRAETGGAAADTGRSAAAA